MTVSVDILLDEHVGRVFERMLWEYGHHVEQAKDRFGERTVDAELLRWCGEHEYLLVTNNAENIVFISVPADALQLTREFATIRIKITPKSI